MISDLILSFVLDFCLENKFTNRRIQQLTSPSTEFLSPWVDIQKSGQKARTKDHYQISNETVLFEYILPEEKKIPPLQQTL